MEGLTTLFVAAFAPSITLLGYYALQVKNQPIPLKWLLGVFAGGLLAAPAALLGFELLSHNEFYSLLSRLDEAHESERFVYALFAIGPLEEMAKFVVVLLTVYHFGHVRRPVEGVLYAVAAALGFATFENWYAMVMLDDPLWYRALTLPFIHALFSSFWGYGLGFEKRALVGMPAGAPLVAAGLVLSFVYHGIYDYILVSDWLPNLLVLPLVLFLWIWMQLALRKAKRAEEA